MNLLGKATDKEFWKEVREKDCYKKFRDELFGMWEKHVENGPILALRYSDYKRYWGKEGNTNIYKGAYFTRRFALNASAFLSLIYPEEEKYLVRLMDQIYAICDEYSWCLPEHQGKLEQNDNKRVDIFAAETGFALAEIYTMLGDRLEPLIKNRIIAEIDRRIVDPITSVDNYGWWENGTNNWTAVCMGSIACTVMLMRPELVEGMIPRFDRAMKSYLSGFTDDGICFEGCGYWAYGFGFFTVYADMIRTFTNGKLDYFRQPKVKAVATFMQKMYLSGKTTVSYSDGPRACGYPIGIIHYLKNEYPNDMIVYKPEYSYNTDNCARFCLHLRSAIWLNEEYYCNPASDGVCVEYYTPSAEWFLKRTESYGFAAKGGNNDAPHNHNDVGTFIFAKNGDQMVMDLGGGEYSRQYFSPERYIYLETDSRGHNVPIIDGKVQFEGSDARARDTKFEDGVFSTDIAGAYKVEGLESVKRSFTFTEDTVTLTDEFVYSGEGEICERLVSYHEMEIPRAGLLKIKDATVVYDPEKYELVLETEGCIGRPKLFAKYATFRLKKGVTVFTVTIC